MVKVNDMVMVGMVFTLWCSGGGTGGYFTTDGQVFYPVPSFNTMEGGQVVYFTQWLTGGIDDTLLGCLHHCTTEVPSVLSIMVLVSKLASPGYRQHYRCPLYRVQWNQYQNLSADCLHFCATEVATVLSIESSGIAIKIHCLHHCTIQVSTLWSAIESISE